MQQAAEGPFQYQALKVSLILRLLRVMNRMGRHRVLLLRCH